HPTSFSHDTSTTTIYTLSLHDALPISDQEFKMLVNYTGFSTEYEVGMGDLEDEFLELYARLGAQNPPLFPETVGALISETLEARSEEHTSELQSRFDLVCRLLLEKKNK